jgi:hypothetical protein
MSYPLEPIDLLVDVSKVLYNERIVEQRRQIEELKRNNENLKQKIVSLLCHKYLIKINDKKYYIISSIIDCCVLFRKIFDDDVLFNKDSYNILSKKFYTEFSDSDDNYEMGDEDNDEYIYGDIVIILKNHKSPTTISINRIHDFPINTTNIIEVY